MPETTYVPRVYQQINKVQKALAAEGITKDRKNTQQGYNFRGIDDVYNALSTLLAANELVIVPHYTERVLVERETKSGGALFNVTVRGDFTIYDAIDGTSVAAGPFYGEAMDSADKATNKAQSAAYKYMAMQTFCIPTEGDNDGDATTHNVAGKKPPPPAPQQAEEEPTDTEADIALTMLTNAAVEGMASMQAKWEGLRDPLRKYIRQHKDESFKTIKKTAAQNTAAKTNGATNATH